MLPRGWVEPESGLEPVGEFPDGTLQIRHRGLAAGLGDDHPIHAWG